MDRFTNMFCWYCKKLPDSNTITVIVKDWGTHRSKDGWTTWFDENGNVSDISNSLKHIWRK